MKKFLAAVFMVASLPIAVSFFSPGNQQPGPVNVIAIAGRTTHGGWCECGTAGCICDPGEVPGGNIRIQPDSKSNKEPAPEAVDPGAAVLLVLFSLLLGVRLRLM
jgi:hypothetical protein